MLVENFMPDDRLRRELKDTKNNEVVGITNAVVNKKLL